MSSPVCTTRGEAGGEGGRCHLWGRGPAPPGMGSAALECFRSISRVYSWWEQAQAEGKGPGEPWVSEGRCGRVWWQQSWHGEGADARLRLAGGRIPPAVAAAPGQPRQGPAAPGPGEQGLALTLGWVRSAQHELAQTGLTGDTFPTSAVSVLGKLAHHHPQEKATKGWENQGDAAVVGWCIRSRMCQDVPGWCGAGGSEGTSLCQGWLLP